MPMPRWEDEDEYLTYLSKVMDRVYRDDPPPTVEQRIRTYGRAHWPDLFVEAISEQDNAFFERCRFAYEDGDTFQLGLLISNAVGEYIKACAIVRNVIDEDELNE